MFQPSIFKGCVSFRQGAVVDSEAKRIVQVVWGLQTELLLGQTQFQLLVYCILADVNDKSLSYIQLPQ